MELNYFVLQFGRLVGCKFEFGNVFAIAVLVGVEVAELRLDEIGAEQGMCDERAGKSVFQNVIANLLLRKEDNT